MSTTFRQKDFATLNRLMVESLKDESDVRNQAGH